MSLFAVGDMLIVVPIYILSMPNQFNYYFTDSRSLQLLCKNEYILLF